jgi:hypothetical protein
MLRLSKITYIPVEICAYVITYKRIRPFQLYIFLKFSCSGKRKISHKDIREIAKELNVKSPKTIRENLNLLQKKDWVGYNAKSGLYFIRSFATIRRIQQLQQSNTCAEFDERDILKTKAFLAGAVIGKLCNTQKWRAWKSERNKQRSKHLDHVPPFFPVADAALASVLNISISRAHRLMALAGEAKYIRIR